MVLSAGVDLIETARIEATIARYGDRFLSRVFTPYELQYCQGSIPQLAARFAAKEAASKVLGTGLQGGITWHDIEIVTEASGKPTIRLHGCAAQRAAQLNLAHFALSLSHTREYAIALVVAE